MKILKSIISRLSYAILIFSLFSCNKQNEWLDAKSNKASVVPQTLKDFQALLSNFSALNNSNLTTGIVGSDNININTADIGGLYETERNLYLWNKTIWVGGISSEWNYYYSAIETSNLVLEGLNTIQQNQTGYNDVKGQAYFYRAWYYYNLAQLFCKPYNATTSKTDLGLPIRLSSDVNVLVQRSTLQQVYDQIVSDASLAFSLLNPRQSYLQRPSSLAAMALLAKVYLVQQNYADAFKEADGVLKIKPTLLDYNNSSIVSNSFAYKFPPNGVGNPEIIFYGEGAGYSSPQGYLGCIGIADPLLYQSYNNNDLRKTTLFGLSVKGYNYIGSYTGNFNNFFGFATNEMYLIRSECNARLGNIQAAMDDRGDSANQPRGLPIECSAIKMLI